MRLLITILIMTLFFEPIQAQESYLHRVIDTIKISTRMGGDKLDSIDLIYTEKYITTPSSFHSHPFGKFGNDYFSFFANQFKQNRILQNPVFRYTALPHLGAHYGFGSKGTQYLVVNYDQSFSIKTHFTLSYTRNVATGAFRFNAFANDLFSIGVIHNGDHWSHSVSATTFKQHRNLSGGVSSFDEIIKYGLDFAKVRKQNTSDSLTQLNINTETQYKIQKKDSLNYLSFVFNNNLNIDKRVFREQDSLTIWYPGQILFDTTKTRDLTQLSRLDNQFGILYKKHGFTSTFLIDKGYWIYKTFSQQIRNELDFIAKFNFKKESWLFESKNQLNIVGANNQSSFFVFLNKKGEKCDFSLNINQTNLLPTPMQRVYITNTLSYVLDELKLQHIQTAKLEFKLKTKQAFHFSLFGGNFKNQYYFLKNRWRNDTLRNVSQLSVQIKGDLNYKMVHLQPNLTINFIDKVQLIPKYDLRARLFLSKELKRKGTLINIGTDFNYKSTYQLMTFDDRISLYKMDYQNSYFLDYMNIDAYISMQMDEFRMYFKMENIDNYWNLPNASFVKNYPTSPVIMRLGLTWDFFN